MDDRVQEHQNEADKNELLLWACARGLMGDVTELLNQGAKADLKDKNGFFPMHFAACHGRLEVVQYLSSKGTDIDAEDRTGRTPLHFAAVHNCPDVVKLLVKKGAWVDGFDGSDNSALHLAAREGYLPVVRILVNSGAKIHLVNKRSLTPLGEALTAGHVEVAKFLAGKNADLRVRCRRFTLLHLTAGMGRDASLSFLLANGAADLVNDADNPEKVTPLHAAAASGSLACVQLLLKHGAKATEPDAEGLLPSDKLPPTPVGGPATNEMKQLSKLLAAKPTTRVMPVPSSAAGIGPPESPKELTFQEKFQRLKLTEQLHKVEALARMQPTDLRGMGILSQEAEEAVGIVRKTNEALDCYKAVIAVRRDEEFQADASDPLVQEAIERIRETNSLEGYSNKDKIMAVLLKLRQLQAVLRTAGGVKLQLKDLLVAEEPDHRQKDDDRLAAMRRNLRKATETAVQIISGKPLKPLEATEAAEGTSSEAIQEIEAAKGAGQGAKSGNVAGETIEEAPKLTFWERMLREFLQQLLQVVIIGSIFFLIMYFTGRLPWQNEDWVIEQLRQKAGPSKPASILDPAVAAQMGAGFGRGRGGGLGEEDPRLQYPYGEHGQEL